MLNTALQYRTCMMDPPWKERGAGKIKRGADKHYETHKVADIYRIVVSAEPWQRLAADAHLYMWVTNNFLLAGARLMGDLGFRYVTNLAWPKGDYDEEEEQYELQMGIGQYFRGEHELCLFGVRGDGYAVRTDRRDLGTVVQGRRTRHSEKPLSMLERIEARSKGPYLEMFGRERWDVWGNDTKGQAPEEKSSGGVMWEK